MSFSFENLPNYIPYIVIKNHSKRAQCSTNEIYKWCNEKDLQKREISACIELDKKKKGP